MGYGEELRNDQLALYYKRMSSACPRCKARPYWRCKLDNGQGYLAFGSVHSERV